MAPRRCDRNTSELPQHGQKATHARPKVTAMLMLRSKRNRPIRPQTAAPLNPKRGTHQPTRG